MKKEEVMVGGWQIKTTKREIRNKKQLSVWLVACILIVVGICFALYLPHSNEPTLDQTLTCSGIQRNDQVADQKTSQVIRITPEVIATVTPSIEEESKCSFLILVNNENKLDDTYEPHNLVSLDQTLDLAVIKPAKTSMCAQAVAVEALNAMIHDADDSGYRNWQISDAYRSVEEQEEIWNKTYQKYISVNELSTDKALQATQRRVAQPGASEHHTGLAFDLTIPGKAFRLTEQCLWLSENCWKYGFVIRYQKEKERLTGITEEPWHIRYVGIDAAKEMLEKSMCLEEFLTHKE